MIEKVFLNDVLLALIVRGEFNQDGIRFFTPDDYSQQLGYMKHPGGYVVHPHVHKPVLREVHDTNEVLFIRKGVIRIDFYDNDKAYLESKILRSGDVILLVNGGHGIEVLEETIMLEVKQGPYAGMNDKVKFTAVDSSKVLFKDPNEILRKRVNKPQRIVRIASASN